MAIKISGNSFNGVKTAISLPEGMEAEIDGNSFVNVINGIFVRERIEVPPEARDRFLMSSAFA